MEEIKELNRLIHVNISDIEEMHGAALVNISEEQMHRNSQRLESVVNETTRLNNETKNRIKGNIHQVASNGLNPFFILLALELSNARMPANSGDLPMRKTQHAALKKKFIESIQRYQDIERTFQQKFRQRVERQIRIGKCVRRRGEGTTLYDDNSHTYTLTRTF